MYTIQFEMIFLSYLDKATLTLDRKEKQYMVKHERLPKLREEGILCPSLCLCTVEIWWKWTMKSWFNSKAVTCEKKNHCYIEHTTLLSRERGTLLSFWVVTQWFWQHVSCLKGLKKYVSRYIVFSTGVICWCCYETKNISMLKPQMWKEKMRNNEMYQLHWNIETPLYLLQ